MNLLTSDSTQDSGGNTCVHYICSTTRWHLITPIATWARPLTHKAAISASRTWLLPSQRESKRRAVFLEHCSGAGRLREDHFACHAKFVNLRGSKLKELLARHPNSLTAATRTQQEQHRARLGSAESSGIAAVVRSAKWYWHGMARTSSSASIVLPIAVVSKPN